MRIAILSDLHLDFYFSPRKGRKVSDTRIRRLFDPLLDPEADVLIVAGDIGHYNTQFYILERLAALYDFKRIFVVPGNHDMYLLSNSAKHKYKTSNARLAELVGMSNDVVRVLDGTIEEYSSVKFGGAMGFYDGTYARCIPFYNQRDPVSLWGYYMNDHKFIKGFKDFYDIFAQERPKIQKVLSADIIITHICPLSEPLAVAKKYRDELSTMFYTYDGEEHLDQTDAKLWVYGHSHGRYEFELYDTLCLSNSMGYPSEPSQRCTIEYDETKKEIINVN